MGNLTSISIFGFWANWTPFFFVGVLCVIILYFLICGKWYKDIPGGRPLRKGEATLFVILMLTIYILEGGPIDLLSHIIFSFHMLQMALLFLIVVPLLYFAIPEYIIKYVEELPVINKIVKLFTKPILAIFLFNGLFSVYHIPLVLDTLKQDLVLHELYTIILFISAWFMWHPIFNKHIPEELHMSNIKKILYIFFIGVLLTPSCGLIIFSGTAMYETYTSGKAWLGAMTLCVPADTLNTVVQGTGLSGPEYFTNFTPLEDQQTGGVIMKVMQEIVFGIYLYIIFMRWFRYERKNEKQITEDSLRKLQEQKALYNQFR